MDIALLSMALSQSHIQQQVSLSVMKTALDQAETNANGLTKIVDSASVAPLQRLAQPHLGTTIDLKA